MSGIAETGWTRNGERLYESVNYPSRALSEVTLIDVLRAVADPIRLEIVQRLADGEPHSKSLGAWDFDLQKSTMSHHFKILREAGITRWLLDGRTHYIQLRRAELDERFPGLIAALAKS